MRGPGKAAQQQPAPTRWEAAHSAQRARSRSAASSALRDVPAATNQQYSNQQARGGNVSRRHTTLVCFFALASYSMQAATRQVSRLLSPFAPFSWCVAWWWSRTSRRVEVHLAAIGSNWTFDAAQVAAAPVPDRKSSAGQLEHAGQSQGTPRSLLGCTGTDSTLGRRTTPLSQR